MWAPIQSNYHDYHTINDPARPLYMPEFQGAFSLAQRQSSS